jgi:hypothetical protein
MDNIKPDIEWKRLFLAIVLTVGGIITIVIPASELDGKSIATIISGIPLVMLGESFFWESMEDIRRARKEKQEAKGTKDK